MDSTKKQLDENGVVLDTDPSSAPKLSPEDARRLIERFTPDQLLDILQDALSRHVDVLDAVRSIADPDVSQRKLFIRGLGWDTTTEGLRSLFSAYGELEEVIVILDKTTGKSKGYGFVTFRHVDSALMALKEPSKKIDGRMTVTQLPSAGNSNSNNVADLSLRKIYVANVPYDMPSDKLLAHFTLYGEIEEEWIRNNSRANERNRRNDRPRNFDRSRNFERMRENAGPSAMPNQARPNSGPGPANMGPPPPNRGPPSSNMGPGPMPPNNYNQMPPNNPGVVPPNNMGPPSNAGWNGAGQHQNNYTPDRDGGVNPGPNRY